MRKYVEKFLQPTVITFKLPTDICSVIVFFRITSKRNDGNQCKSVVKFRQTEFTALSRDDCIFSNQINPLLPFLQKLLVIADFRGETEIERIKLVDCRT